MDNEHNLCKLCFVDNIDSFQIFNSKQGEEMKVDIILMKYLGAEINLSKDDVVCYDCWNIVNNFHQLYLRVEQNHQTELVAEENPIAHVAVKLEVIDEQILEDNTLSIKQENKLTDEQLIDEIRDDKEKLDDILEAPQPDIKPPTKSSTKRMVDKKRSAVVKKSGPGRPSKSIDEELKTIKRHFKMNCDICLEPVRSFRDVIKHYKKVHNVAGYMICKCGEKLVRYKRIVKHCHRHDYPDDYKCPECPKTFNHIKILQRHIEIVHNRQEQDNFKCDSCPMAFTLKGQLDLHEKTAHKDKTYECPTCHKKLANIASVKKHIKQVHELAFSIVCELCAQFFKTQKSYAIHCMVNHSNIDTKVQCDECGKWLKHSLQLDVHKNMLHRKKESAPLQCTQCNKMFKHQRGLNRHVEGVHTDSKYECSICHKMFKRKISLKEHLPTHQGRTDLYTCTFCPKTFRAGTNMSKHRREVHPAEWKKYKEDNEI